jgi:LiaF transmembrane domain
MHIRRGYLGWGVFLILAGAVPLAVRQGYLNSEQVDRLWTLWPLILVGIGLGLILSRTPFEFVGGIVVAATFGLMAGGLLSNGFGPIPTGACGQGSGLAAFEPREGTLASAGGTIDVEADCADLTVGVGPGTTWRVEGEDDTGAGPDVESSDTSVSIRRPDGGGDGPFWALGGRDTWRVTVPAGAPFDLRVQLNAGQATLDLGAGRVGTFTLQLNAGSTTVDLGSAETVQALDMQLNAGSLGVTLPHGSTTGSIHANAGAVRLCSQPGVALKLHTGQSIIASYDYAGHGLVQDGSTWTTPGFEAASQKVELTTEANAGSFVLDPEEGCD